MTHRLDGILRAVSAQPWAIQPEKLDAILDVLEMRAAGLTFTREEIQARVGDGRRTNAPTAAQGSVAILPMYGVLSQRMNLMSDVSGGTSTEKFAAELDALVNNPQVSAIVLDVDSEGGSTFGIPEAAAKIRAAREVKPIYAVANGIMASAAYWLSAQATEVIASPSAFVGSIGVFGVHTDITGAEEKAGIKRTIISAGKYKAEGIGALGDDARGAMQATVDQMYAMFVADVAKGRGVTASAVRSGYGEGRALLAKDALDAGMIDRVATLDDVVAELTAGQPPGRQRLRAESAPQLAASLGGVLVSGTVVETAASTETAIRLVPVEPNGSTQPSPSAPKAKENTVSDTPTVVPGATSAELATVQAELARRESIAQLCALAGASLSDMNTFIASGKTADQVRQELAGRQKAPSATAVTGMVDREATRPFASLGEQLRAIAHHGMGLGTDKRLLQLNAALSSGAASANVPSDGSFQIQQDFALDLTKDAFGEGTLAGDCSKTPVSGTSDGLRVMYIDETSRATGSRWGGVQVYRGAEGDSPTAKKPQFGEWERRVYDIIGAAKVSERLLDDTTALASVLSESFTNEFDFVVDDEIVRGTGAGQCLGVLNSPALVSVPKETGQIADTVVAENIIKMWARLLPRAKRRAKWYINQEIEQQLQTMQIGTGASGQLVYMPPGGLSGSPFGTIYGRPVQVVEQCSAPGDVGDVILADLSGYKLITKGELQNDDSIHVAFLTHERTFRWLKRVGGAPKLKSALTPYKGSNTLSDHVALAAR